MSDDSSARILVLAKSVFDTMAGLPRRVAADVASTTNRLTRSMVLRELGNQLGTKAWIEFAKDLYVEQLAGVASELDAARDEFVGVFSKLLLDSVDRLRRPPALEWREVIDPAVASELPPSPRGPWYEYVLVYDEQRRQVCYAATGNDALGPWSRWSGERWESDGADIHATPDCHTPFQAFYDPSRNGVACWTYLNSTNRVVGFLRDHQGLREIVCSGDVPTVPGGLAMGVVVGFDRSRNVTVALGQETLWEAGIDGNWTRVRDIPSAMTSRQWHPDSAWTLYDEPSRCVLFGWRDFDSEWHILRWKGATSELEIVRGIPRRPAAFVCIDGVLVFLSDSGYEAMFPGTSASFEMPQPWPQVWRTRAAWDPERRELVLGPGQFSSGESFGRPVDLVSFVALGKTVRWTGSPAPGGAAPLRWLLARAGGVVAVFADGVVWTRTKNDWLITAAVALPYPVIAVAVGPNDMLLAVTEDGVAWRGDGTGWSESSRVGAELVAGRAGLLLAFDPPRSRFIACRGIRDGARCDDTIAFELDSGWRRLDTPPPATRGSGNSGRFRLLHDHHLGMIVLFGDYAATVLLNDRWLVLPCQDLRMLMTETIAIADPQSREILIIQLDRMGVARFDAGAVTPVAFSGECSPGTVAAWEAAWVYDPAGRELWCFEDEALRRRRVLDVAPALEFAAACGPRAPFVFRHASELDPVIASAIRASATELAALDKSTLEQITGVSAHWDMDGRDTASKLWSKRGREIAGSFAGAIAAASGLDAGLPLFLDTFSSAWRLPNA